MSALTLSAPGIVPFAQLVQEATRLAVEAGLGRLPHSQPEPGVKPALSQEARIVQDPWLDWIDTH